MPRTTPNLTGETYGLLTAVRMVGRTARGNALWECSCSCGGSTVIEAARLKLPGMRSCGCMVAKRPYTKLFKHGMSTSPEWAAWKSMLERCTNPSHRWFHRYGGRGVSVCKRWSDFNNFYADMGERPKDGVRYSLDRIDNDKGYEPGNCKWATSTEQNRNRGNVIRITHDGLTLTLPEWSQKSGLHIETIRRRVKNGWPTERLFDASMPRHLRTKGFQV